MIQRSPGYDDPYASICEAAGAGRGRWSKRGAWMKREQEEEEEKEEEEVIHSTLKSDLIWIVSQCSEDRTDEIQSNVLVRVAAWDGHSWLKDILLVYTTP